ncbi:glucokinase [Ideonella sp.]|uniref:glucokinase n=1 Tax=Ideonella sp. TaxID=1929293 RepID=UPI0037C14746
MNMLGALEPLFPRLVGDVGGTNARWAWQAAPGAALSHMATYPCADYPSMAAVIQHYLAEHQHPTPAAVSFGIATAVTGDEVRMTNHHWAFSTTALQAELGVQRLVVLNDFAALASSLDVLGPQDRRAVGGGQPVLGQPIGVLGPGTGLGVAGLVCGRDGHYVPVAGEGGHVTLAATDEREAAVLAVLRQRFGHASAERAVCGQGLVNLYEALCTLDGAPTLRLSPADVTEAALLRSNPACVEAVHLFCSFLGNVAGNLALTLGARGGIYVGGGIVPRLGDAFEASAFRERFEQKGRFTDYLRQIPTWVITAHNPALIGAGHSLDD